MTSITPSDDCPFCVFAAGRKHTWYEGGYYDDESGDIMRIVPKKPVVDGHRLFVPKLHVPGPSFNPFITGMTFVAATEYASTRVRPYNLIVSSGKIATQTIFHLHVHYIPRSVDDGVRLPWS